MAEKNIIIVCGEASGDLNAASLAKALIKLNPGLEISGVGGPLLRASGVDIFYDIKNLSVIGLFDVLKKLPVFFGLKKMILEKIRAEKPRAIILVDFSGFNLRLAKAINKAIPVIYYTSPQVWASRPGRIKTIQKYVHKMIVFFKFEEELYKKSGVDVTCVGHPLLDIVKSSMAKANFLSTCDLSRIKTTIALLPGSRPAEVNYILPVMVEACRMIQKKLKSIQVVIAKSTQVDWGIYRKLTKIVDFDFSIVEGKTYDCLEAADFCLVASGTATLETAIMQKPFVIIYKMNPLNFLLYRPMIKIPFIGMVNILLQKKIIPEFIQDDARPQAIADEARRILTHASEKETIKNNLAQLKTLLGEKGAALRAARLITDFL